MEDISAPVFTNLPRWTPKNIWRYIRRYETVLVFVGGFLFDVMTLVRIDAWFDLAIQLSYLLGITFLLLWQAREAHRLWQPPSPLKRWWPYNIEVLYFIYGGLFSNYVVLYFKSTSGARTLSFFVLLAVLLFINEMPQMRRLGFRLRLGIFAFCWASFLIYFVPIVVGRMGDFIFLISMGLSFGLTWKMAGLLVLKNPSFKADRLKLFWPAGVVLTLITLLYFFCLIPPVPLSVQYQGIFHDVEKQQNGYQLKAENSPFYLFWRKDSRPFHYVEGESVYYFVRIFAPARFQHNVRIRWEKKDEKTGEFLSRDLIPLQVMGGRSQGYRGFVAKSNFEEGRWRVSAETENERTISTLTFDIRQIIETDRRGWQTQLM